MRAVSPSRPSKVHSYVNILYGKNDTGKYREAIENVSSFNQNNRYMLANNMKLVENSIL